MKGGIFEVHVLFQLLKCSSTSRFHGLAFILFPYGYNIRTEQEFIVTAHESRQQSPAVYEDVVVWEDHRNGNWDIYGCYLQSPLTFTQSSNVKFVLLGGLCGILAVIVVVIVFAIRECSK